jgi:hypothetical protein
VGTLWNILCDPTVLMIHTRNSIYLWALTLTHCHLSCTEQVNTKFISIWANLHDRIWHEDYYWHYQWIMCLAPWSCLSIINHHYIVKQEKEWGINCQRYIKNVIFIHIHLLKMSFSIMLWKLFKKYLQFVSMLSHLSLWYFYFWAMHL